MILAISYSLQKTYVIYNYENVDWILATKNVFIGYSDANGFSYTNPYSNNGDVNNDPSLLMQNKGNTGFCRKSRNHLS